MRHLAAAQRLLFRPKRFTTIVMMLIIWAGVAGALFAAISSDLRNRDYLRGQSQTIAYALPLQDIKDLHGSTDDLVTNAYGTLKDRLGKIRAGNRDIGQVYLIGLQDEKIEYYVNSELQNSRLYTSPGTQYTNPSPQLLSVFDSDTSIVQGPTRSQSGVWISAFTPIVDPKTNQTIAVVGIDAPAATYYGQIALYALVPLLLAAIPLLGILRDIKLSNKEYDLLQLKNEFVSIASHELRSPLTGILWAIQSLSKSSADRLNLEQMSMLGSMYHSAEASLATVNEILDFSIFDRGQANKLQHELTDVKAVLKQVVATLQLGAHEKRLTIEPAGEWPRDVDTLGDVAALKRAFMNVISNAIKYSNDGSSIDLTYSCANGMHMIGVRDHGIGIPEDEQEKVLEGYYRARNATKVEVHGTGLGLLVTKKIIEQHKGKLWFESKLNEGTTFYISLPVAAQKTDNATDQEPAESAESMSRGPNSSSTNKPLPQTEAHDSKHPSSRHSLE